MKNNPMWLRPWLFALLCASVAAAHADTFVVSDTTDAVDTSPGDGTCATSAADCTVRAAIQESNAHAGPDIIEIPAGVYGLSIPSGAENGFSGLDAAVGDLDVTEELTLSGAGAGRAILDGSSTARLLHVGNGAVATIAGVTIRNGRAASGAGILGQGAVLIDRCIVDGNTSSGQGGGIFSAGPLTITRSTVSGNTSTGHQGGGIFTEIGAGPVLINESTVRGNVASHQGAGIFSDGPLTITNSTISDNTSTNEQGGGIFIENGPLTLVNSTISGNHAAVSGGGIFNNPPLGGSNSVRIINSTITSNTSSEGGGIYTFDPGTITMRNALVANNLDEGDWSPDVAGTVNSEGYNLIGTVGGGTTVIGDTTGNVIGQDPRLGTLGDNGGLTHTHPLLASSPAIDAGNPRGCIDEQGGSLTADQRGQPRPSGARCDIGSFELFAPQEICNNDGDDDGDGLVDIDDPNCQLDYDGLQAFLGDEIVPHEPLIVPDTGDRNYTIAPALPSGLTLDPATGVITGAPGTLHPLTTYDVTMSSPNGSATGQFKLRVDEADGADASSRARICRALARKYRPILELNDDDDFWPTTLRATFLLEWDVPEGDCGGRLCAEPGHHRFSGDASQINHWVEENMCPNVGNANVDYLDFPAGREDRREQKKSTRQALVRAHGLSQRYVADIDEFKRLRRKTARIYYSCGGGQSAADNHPRAASSLQFWFFYQYNYVRVRIPSFIPIIGGSTSDWFMHEGDFEGMQIMFARPTPEDPLRRRPLYVRMNQHGKSQPYMWDSPELNRYYDHQPGRGSHPVGYVARGSHATYPKPGSYSYFGSDKISRDRSDRYVMKRARLVRLAASPWRCWKGVFGKGLRPDDCSLSSADIALLAASFDSPVEFGQWVAEHLLDGDLKCLKLGDSPKSPMWQQSDFNFNAHPCSNPGQPTGCPSRGAIAQSVSALGNDDDVEDADEEEVINDATSDALEEDSADMREVFGDCQTWLQPSSAVGTRVVACDQQLLDAFFATELTDPGPVHVTIERDGVPVAGQDPPSVFWSDTPNDLAGLSLTTDGFASPSVAIVVANEDGSHETAVCAPITMSAGTRLVLQRKGEKWELRRTDGTIAASCPVVRQPALPPEPVLPPPCDPLPRTGCMAAASGGATILVKNSGKDQHDALIWKWKGAGPVTKADFGSPGATTAYTACLYDRAMGMAQQALAVGAAGGDVCAGKPWKPCWKETTTGYAYRNKANVSGVATSLKLQSGADGRAKIAVQASGPGLQPSLPLIASPSVVMQLVSSEGRCWEATYSAVARNDAGRFQAKSN